MAFWLTALILDCIINLLFLLMGFNSLVDEMSRALFMHIISGLYIQTLILPSTGGGAMLVRIGCTMISTFSVCVAEVIEA